MKNWIKCAGVRAIKTMAQTAVSLITVGATMSEIDWAVVGSASLLAGILSILTSVAGLPETKNVSQQTLEEVEEVEESEVG
jgi:hypothetical protein